MNKKYQLAVYLSIALLCVLYSFSYSTFTKVQEPVTETEPVTEMEEELIQSAPANNQDDEKVYSYYLIEVDGFVAVYESDQKTLFETTSIRMDSLPAEVQEEIRKNKGLTDEHELYSFLENYSS